jgi:hypothetical protein
MARVPFKSGSKTTGATCLACGLPFRTLDGKYVHFSWTPSFVVSNTTSDGSASRDWAAAEPTIASPIANAKAVGNLPDLMKRVPTIAKMFVCSKYRALL